MNVLFATAHKMLPENRGGMEQNTHVLARGLTARGYRVASFSGLAGVGRIGHWARLQMRLGRDVGVDRSLGYPSFRAYEPADEMEAVLKRVRPDIVCVQGGHDHMRLCDTALQCGFRVVMYYHSDHVQPLSAVQQDAVKAGRLHFAANSGFTASLAADRGPAVIRPVVLPNAYKVNDHDPRYVTFINPSPHKGVDIARAVAAARPDMKFLFVRTHAYDKLERQNIAAPNIDVIGPVSDMRTVYRQSKLVLAPSQCREAWGRIATEAHISGIPVLASDQGGLPEAVGEGGICLAHEASLADWCAALDEIVADEGRYTAYQQKALRAAARPEVQPGIIMDAFEAVLRRGNA